MRFSTLLTAAVAMSALCWTGASAISSPAAAQKATESTTAEIGKPAPAFTLMDTAGKPVSLSDFKGKTVVIEWFCPTCPFSGRSSGKSIHSTGRVRALLESMKQADPDAVYLLIDSSTKKMRVSAEELAKLDAEVAKKADTCYEDREREQTSNIHQVGAELGKKVDRRGIRRTCEE